VSFHTLTWLVAVDFVEKIINSTTEDSEGIQGKKSKGMCC